VTNLRWNTTGVTVAGDTNGIHGTAPNQLYWPYDIFIGSNDILYVADASNNRIQKWLPNSSNGSTIAGYSNGSAGLASGALKKPTGVYVDQNQNLYIADNQNYRIQYWPYNSTSGITIAGNGTNGSSNTLLSTPYNLRLDLNGNVYLTDYFNQRVMKFTPNSTTGSVVAGENGAGNLGSQLNNPSGFCLDVNNNIMYISNPGRNSISKWILNSSNGTTIAGISGTPGSNSTLLNNPRGIIFDHYGNLYVADTGNNRIQMFYPNSTHGITIVGNTTAGNSSSLLNNPRSIAFDTNLNLYVADTYNNRIQKFSKL
ncbi:unnamed protein product, partial [Didymodactylos carnosus]